MVLQAIFASTSSVELIRFLSVLQRGRVMWATTSRVSMTQFWSIGGKRRRQKKDILAKVSWHACTNFTVTLRKPRRIGREASLHTFWESFGGLGQ
jgi:hypothetical protein